MCNVVATLHLQPINLLFNYSDLKGALKETVTTSTRCRFDVYITSICLRPNTNELDRIPTYVFDVILMDVIKSFDAVSSA